MTGDILPHETGKPRPDTAMARPLIRRMIGDVPAIGTAALTEGVFPMVPDDDPATLAYAQMQAEAEASGGIMHHPV